MDTNLLINREIQQKILNYLQYFYGINKVPFNNVLLSCLEKTHIRKIPDSIRHALLDFLNCEAVYFDYHPEE